MVETQSSPLELVIESCHGYLDARLEHRWGQYGTVGRGLRFSDSARTRIGQIFGTIWALAERRDLAEQMAESICRQLDFLSTYGGEVEPGVPAYLVELRDDGTWGGFSILWHQAVAEKQLKEVENRLRRVARPEESFIVKGYESAKSSGLLYTKYRYICTMNGGLLYHGPGQGEIYAVNLGGSLWSIHT